MELVEVLQQIIQDNQKAMQPTDLVVGTVTKVKPLEITTDNQAAPLRSPVLYLTESVIEKKVTSFAHKHDTTHNHVVTDATIQPAGECSTELTEIVCYENGKALPYEGFVTLNRGLEVGDKVLLLRVQRGQKYVVLSRVFQEV